MPLAAGAAVGAVGAAATVASAQARPNPVPYPPDAYARSTPPAAPVTTSGTPPPPPSVDGDREDDGGGSSPWGWIAGLLGIGILAIVGFLVFRMLTGGGGEEPSASPASPRPGRRSRCPGSWT